MPKQKGEGRAHRPRTTAKIELDLDEADRLLGTIEDARMALQRLQATPDLCDALVTWIRVLHSKMGLEEGGLE